MKKNIEVIGIVPVKAKSDRVKKKNLRKFGDTNLFELKLKQLKKTKNFKYIIVSSEDKKILAKTAINIEQNVMKEKCGSQDQIWAAYGGFNTIKFKGKSFKVEKLGINKSKLSNLSKNLFLIYTGINKFSHIIEKDKISKLNKNLNYLNKIYDLAKSFKHEIQNNNSDDFIGTILNEYWSIKKSLSNKVSNNKINEIYNEALKSGASGGKIIGSGGGGFLLIHCKQKKHRSLKKKLNKLPIIKFNFVEKGSEVIFKS